MTITEFRTAAVALAGTVAFIVGTAFAIDARCERAGAAERAEISSNIFTVTMAIVGKASTIYRYDVLESVGLLFEEDIARRAQLQVEMDSFTTQAQALQERLNAL